MLEPRLLLPRHVEQPRQIVPRGVLIAGVPQKNLDTMNQTPWDVSLARWGEVHCAKSLELLTCIMAGWSLVLFPGHGVPSDMTQPSSGTFPAFAAR